MVAGGAGRQAEGAERRVMCGAVDIIVWASPRQVRRASQAIGRAVGGDDVVRAEGVGGRVEVKEACCDRTVIEGDAAQRVGEFLGGGGMSGGI